MKREYRILSLEPEGPFPLDTEKELNALGRDGWEMVSAIRAHNSSSITMMYFKRPLEEV